MVTNVERLLAAALDTLTGASCVSYWAGVWSLLDAFNVDELASGSAAVVLLSLLAIATPDQWLEKQVTTWVPVAGAAATWVWTCCLAVLSILVWRVSFFCIHAHVLHPGNNIHAILLASLGAVVLIATGRFRSASSAAPVGIVADAQCGADAEVSGIQFAPAIFSGPKLTGILRDLVLTLPVVFVWAGVWMLNDNLSVPPLLSALACSGVTALFATFSIDDSIRAKCSGLCRGFSALADIAWTSFLALLVIGVWRGIWETLDGHFHLSKNSHIAAATALAGAIGLTSLQRHRSALFPPVDFALDKDEPFASVGSQPWPKEPIAAADTAVYNGCCLLREKPMPSHDGSA